MVAVARPRRRYPFVVFAALCTVIAVAAPVPYLVRSLDSLAESGAGLARHFAAQPRLFRAALIVHAASGGAALLLLPFQLSRGVRRRWRSVHRGIGRLAGTAMFVAAASGFVIAQVSYAGTIGTLGFSALAVLWGLSALQTGRHAMAGRLADHERWALRAAALTFSAVTLRVWLVVLIAAQRPASQAAFEAAFDRAYKITPILSWVPNLVIVEWMLRRRQGDYVRPR